MFHTLRTVTGYLATLVEKYTNLKVSKNSISCIYNYLEVGEKLVTSGQPTEEQFVLIKDRGYNTVINLAPENAENSLHDEGLLLKDLGITYIHIPVDFKNPSEEDFDRFSDLLGRLSWEETWIHCAANMRVSAFVYRYRCEVLNEDSEEAKKDLRKIWEPVGVWKKFISKT